MSDQEPQPSHDSRGPLILSAVGLGAFVLFRLLRLWTGDAAAVAAQTPDDAYYYYGVAHHLADGMGSTFDGHNPTNGYHPLWMAVCWALARVTTVPDVLPRAAQTVQLVLGATAVLLLARAAFVALRKNIAPAVVIAVACTPWVAYGLADGLESGIALLAGSAILWWACHRRVHESPPGSNDLVWGVLLALGFLARLDLALLCVAIGLRVGFKALFFPPRPTLAMFLGKSSLWALPVVLAFVAYLAVNGHFFDTRMPISGMLKSTFPHPHLHLEWVRQNMVAFAAFPAVVVGWWLARKRDSALAFTLSIGAVFIALHAVHTVFFMNWAVHKWHFTSWWVFALPAAAVLVSGIVDLRFPRRAAAAFPWIAIAGLIALGAVGQWAFFRGRQARAFQVRSHDAAVFLRTLKVPPTGMRLGMTDCGVFGYFMGGGVVNLDGVINNRAFQDMVARDGLPAYLDQQRIWGIAHHAMPVSRLAPGYGSIPYTIKSRLHGTESTIALLETNEVYRSEPYDDGSGAVVFILWSLTEKTSKFPPPELTPAGVPLPASPSLSPGNTAP